MLEALHPYCHDPEIRAAAQARGVTDIANINRAYGIGEGPYEGAFDRSLNYLQRIHDRRVSLKHKGRFPKTRLSNNQKKAIIQRYINGNI